METQVEVREVMRAHDANEAQAGMIRAQSLGSEQAHPSTEHYDSGAHYLDHAGLTKREAFAMAAMQGMLASNFDQTFQPAITLPYAELAKQSAEYADALLIELAKDGAR